MIVSVLMPTYNRVDMLPGAIESFLNQDYDNAKLFILNNGSTDGTADFLKQYEHHPKIEVITLSHNILPPHNFNLLLHDYAFGDLVCHLHDDDRLLPKGISLRVEAFKKDPSLDVVYAGWITNGKTYYADPPFKERIIKEEYINYLTMMWKLKKVDGTFDTDLRYYHDWLFKIECFMKHKVGHIMQPVVDYTIHLGQASIECRKLGMNGIEEQLMRKKLNERYGI
jgi:glycosyltransferase involved in cell wall biosynthesis